MGRELVDPRVESVRCRVCNSSDVHLVLDLHDQPLANDFRPTAEMSMECPRHPLKLVRCRKCHHAQLSVMVDRRPLFTNYSYRSGTSRTLNDYFGWLARRISSEVPAGATPRTILELACNDGTQLNHFKTMGWSTFGVDPAENLVKLARDNGHTVVCDLWAAVKGKQYSELPVKVDAVLAQNVLAHVPNPVDFLVAVANMMHEKSRAYMQTSQCEMFANGQFDTVYHEHISFFSPTSFAKSASLAGLRIVKYEITPIHGGSCFVTLVKDPMFASDGSLERAITVDEARGQLGDVFYTQYRGQAMATRRWLVETLDGVAEQPADIVGYDSLYDGLVPLYFRRS